MKTSIFLGAVALTLTVLATAANAATVTNLVPEAGYPPQRGIPPGDTTARRLAAVQRDLQTAVNALAQAPREPHGGFVEKAVADANHALADVAKGFEYLAAHPEADSTNTWGGSGRMPDPLRRLPNYADANAFAPGPRGSRGFVPEGDPYLLAAYPALRAAENDMMTGPEVKPYQIGEVGGQREAIRHDITQAVVDLIAALDFAHAAASHPAPASADGELVINGSFEIPDVAAPPPPGVISSPTASLSVGTSDGGEPAGFGWRVKSGSPFAPGRPIVIHQGFNLSAQKIQLDAPAYDGRQWLDLVGGGSGATNGPSLSQILPTTPGRQYVLTFAYANCPFPPAAMGRMPAPEPYPYAATVTIRDTAGGNDLIKPLSIAHETATATDYHWTLSAPVTFTAQTSSTTLQFQASYQPRGIPGLFLDAISVKPVPADK